MRAVDTNGDAGLLLTLPILGRMSRVEGWLELDEADLLIAAAARVLVALPEPPAVVEVGSYCGRSTVVLASVIRALCPLAKVHAIDPHGGTVGAVDQGLRTDPPTLDKFKRNLADAGLTRFVEIIQRYSFEVAWQGPIGLLLIDGLHDYANVAQDFGHFEPWIVPGGFVAFHDYADYFPGVRTFVDEVLVFGAYRKVHCVRSMMLVQKAANNHGRHGKHGKEE